MTTIARVRVLTEFDADSPVGDRVVRCWLNVSNAGGAVGFPFLPVTSDEVRNAARRLAADVASGAVLLFIAESGTAEADLADLTGDVVGWVALRLNASQLTRHWATVERLQSRPERRGQGIGKQVMETVAEHARSAGLEHLRLVLRSGENPEAFYAGLGWTEIGRHPGALRLTDNDDRDEVLMLLPLS